MGRCQAGGAVESQGVCFWYRLPLLYYSGLMLCGTEDNKEQIWLTVITEFLVFVFVALVAAADDGAFKSKRADQHIVANGLPL